MSMVATQPASPVALRYASALVQAAGPAGAAALRNPVAQLLAAVSTTGVPQALANPKLKPAQRQAFVAQLAKTVQAPTLLANLMGVLARQQRLAFLPQVLAAVQMQLDAAAGLAHVQLHTATALTPEQTVQLKVILKQALKCQNVELHTTLQPSLIGGFQAFFGNQVWDTSVRRTLGQLVQRLTHNISSPSNS